MLLCFVCFNLFYFAFFFRSLLFFFFFFFTRCLAAVDEQHIFLLFVALLLLLLLLALSPLLHIYMYIRVYLKISTTTFIQLWMYVCMYVDTLARVGATFFACDSSQRITTDSGTESLAIRQSLVFYCTLLPAISCVVLCVLSFYFKVATADIHMQICMYVCICMSLWNAETNSKPNNKAVITITISIRSLSIPSPTTCLYVHKYVDTQVREMKRVFSRKQMSFARRCTCIYKYGHTNIYTYIYTNMYNYSSSSTV